VIVKPCRFPQWCPKSYHKKLFHDKEEYVIGCLAPGRDYDPYAPYAYPPQYYEAEASTEGEAEQQSPALGRSRHRLQAVLKDPEKKRRAMGTVTVVQTEEDEAFRLPPGHYRPFSAADLPDPEM
jgi:hypothetical protein